LCTQQQLYDIYNLGQSCQQAEYALAQGMIELQQIIDKATLAGDKEFQQTYVPQHLSFFKEVIPIFKF
jgi:transcription factor TGA